MLQPEQALAFARRWIECWNSGDIDRISQCYAEDCEFSSPLIVERLKLASGRLRGRQALREYWMPGLGLQPSLHFVLLDVLVGIDSITVYYRSVGRRVVAETMKLDLDGRISAAAVHWSAEKPNPTG
ncbi:MAG: nuclear transport factor 2 family protein [Leptospirales bacterium]|nr:nuclear transport factor 2 family protein [Leptospirales bacterium]